jgi:hypothetical protein
VSANGPGGRVAGEKARTKEDQITARQGHLARMVEIARINKGRYDAGRISAQDCQESVRWMQEAQKGVIRAKAE